MFLVKVGVGVGVGVGVCCMKPEKERSSKTSKSGSSDHAAERAWSERTDWRWPHSISLESAGRLSILRFCVDVDGFWVLVTEVWLVRKTFSPSF